MRKKVGPDRIELVVAKGYLTKLLAHDEFKSYITWHGSKILERFELVVNTVSMKEAAKQQLKGDGEFKNEPDSDD